MKKKLFFILLALCLHPNVIYDCNNTYQKIIATFNDEFATQFKIRYEQDFLSQTWKAKWPNGPYRDIWRYRLKNIFYNYIKERENRKTLIQYLFNQSKPIPDLPKVLLNKLVKIDNLDMLSIIPFFIKFDESIKERSTCSIIDEIFSRTSEEKSDDLSILFETFDSYYQYSHLDTYELDRVQNELGLIDTKIIKPWAQSYVIYRHPTHQTLKFRTSNREPVEHGMLGLNLDIIFAGKYIANKEGYMRAITTESGTFMEARYELIVEFIKQFTEMNSNDYHALMTYTNDLDRLALKHILTNFFNLKFSNRLTTWEDRILTSKDSFGKMWD